MQHHQYPEERKISEIERKFRKTDEELKIAYRSYRGNIEKLKTAYKEVSEHGRFAPPEYLDMIINIGLFESRRRINEYEDYLVLTGGKADQEYL